MSAAHGSSAMPPPSLPRSHHRTHSSVAQSPRVDTFKRMSMEVPAPKSAASTRADSVATTFTEEPSEVSSPGSRYSLSFEPANSLLTAVAAQERRVLELREELQKAEGELRSLKTQWAQQEAVKKRQEVRTQTEVMRPLTSPTHPTPTMECLPHRTSLSLEDERKKAMHARPRVPERKVFTGRHTRTLSLLSPDTLATFGPVQTDPDSQAGRRALPRASTGAATGGAAAGFTGRPHAGSTGTKDDLVNTGKQLVGDLREGLWNFWDDLRQATVGDEAAMEPHQRRQSMARSPARPDGPSRDSSSASLKAKGIRKNSRSPHARSATVSGLPSTPARRLVQGGSPVGITAESEVVGVGLEDGGWSNWDSPAAKTVSSVADTGVPSPAGSTPRTSLSSNGDDNNHNNNSVTGQKGSWTRSERTGPDSEQMGLQPSTPTSKDAIPWPSLHKLSPGNLQRKANHLMSSWEQSLTPPAEESEQDWIDRYIDGPRQRKGTKSDDHGEAEQMD